MSGEYLIVKYGTTRAASFGAVFCLLLAAERACGMKKALVLATILMPALVQGQDAEPIHPYLSNKFSASVGLFLPNQNTRLGLGASVEISIPDPDPAPFELIEFHETFGFSNSDETFSAEIGWRFGKKWQLRGQYFGVDNNSRVSLEEDVEWGDVVFNEGTFIGAGSDYQVTRLFFGRTFNSTDSQELGFGLGAHVLDISAYINGNATIDGIDVGYRQERASISQPLPNFGAWYMHAFSEEWASTIRFDWLSASIDEYDGYIINSAISVGYAVTDHFGIGLAYNFFEIDLKVDDTDWTGRIKSRFDGPYLSLTGYW